MPHRQKHLYVLLDVVSFIAGLLNISFATFIYTVTFSVVVKTNAVICDQFSRSVLFAGKRNVSAHWRALSALVVLITFLAKE